MMLGYGPAAQSCKVFWEMSDQESDMEETYGLRGVFHPKRSTEYPHVLCCDGKTCIAESADKHTPEQRFYKSFKAADDDG